MSRDYKDIEESVYSKKEFRPNRLRFSEKTNEIFKNSHSNLTKIIKNSEIKEKVDHIMFDVLKLPKLSEGVLKGNRPIQLSSLMHEYFLKNVSKKEETAENFSSIDEAVEVKVDDTVVEQTEQPVEATESFDFSLEAENDETKNAIGDVDFSIPEEDNGEKEVDDFSSLIGMMSEDKEPVEEEKVEEATVDSQVGDFDFGTETDVDTKVEVENGNESEDDMSDVKEGFEAFAPETSTISQEESEMAEENVETSGDFSYEIPADKETDFDLSDVLSGKVSPDEILSVIEMNNQRKQKYIESNAAVEEEKNKHEAKRSELLQELNLLVESINSCKETINQNMAAVEKIDKDNETMMTYCKVVRQQYLENADKFGDILDNQTQVGRTR